MFDKSSEHVVTLDASDDWLSYEPIGSYPAFMRRVSDHSQEDKQKPRLRSKVSIIPKTHRPRPTSPNKTIPSLPSVASSLCSSPPQLNPRIDDDSDSLSHSTNVQSATSSASPFRRVKSFQRLRERFTKRKDFEIKRLSMVSTTTTTTEDDEEPVSPRNSMGTLAMDRRSSASTLPECRCTRSLSRVVQELIETEKSYEQDMHVVKEVYYEPAGMWLHPSDIGPIFTNLMDLLDFESKLLPRLVAEAPAALPYRTCSRSHAVARVLLDMMDELCKVYTEYCRRHGEAIEAFHRAQTRPDVQVFFQSCDSRMQGRTTSWDLGSLLIKPVQRVLKYPLLLKEMLVLVPPDHEGYEDLVAASQAMQKVADHLNEVKRRHDIVGHIVRDPGPQAIKAANKGAAGDDSESRLLERKRTKKKGKKLLFQKQQRSEPMPAPQQHPPQNDRATSETTEMADNALMARFERQHSAAKAFVAHVLAWQASVKTQREALHHLAQSFEAFYGSWGRVHEFSVQTRLWATERKLESRMIHFISVRLDTLVRLYENPHKVVIELESCQDEKDAAAIRSQLREELPRFLELAAIYFNTLVGELLGIQADYSQWLTRGWRGLQRPLDEEDTRTPAEAYLDRMRPVQECLDNIMNAHRRKMRAFYS